jgi:polyhydroxyalkanoate synthase subunit PhaC
MQASDETIRQTIAALNAGAERCFAQLMSTLSGSASLDTAAVVAAINAAIQQDPARWEAMQQRHSREQISLWRRLAQGETTPPPEQPDRRFRAPEWYTLPYFNYLRASYLLNASWLTEMTAALPLTGRDRQRMDFFTRQLIDATAPANFAATNPEVIQLAAASHNAMRRRLKSAATSPSPPARWCLKTS